VASLRQHSYWSRRFLTRHRFNVSKLFDNLSLPSRGNDRWGVASVVFVSMFGCSSPLQHNGTSSPALAERPRVQYVERNLLLLATCASDLSLRTIKCCSVVFGVTFRLLAMNTSSSVFREQRTTPLTNDECHQLAAVWRSCVCNTWRSDRWEHAMKSDIGQESRFLPTQPAFDAPVRGVFVELPWHFGAKKLEWCGYPTVNKFWRYVYSFRRSWRTWRTDGRTDGHRMTLTGKNGKSS